MRTDPRVACANERQRFWWAVLHDLVAHPLMALTGWSKWALRLHDWTSHRAWPRKPAPRQPLRFAHRTLDFEYAHALGMALRAKRCPFCTTAEPHYHEDGKIYYVYTVELLG